MVCKKRVPWFNLPAIDVKLQPRVEANEKTMIDHRKVSLDFVHEVEKILLAESFSDDPVQPLPKNESSVILSVQRYN